MLCVGDAGTEAAEVQCPCCPAVCGGEEEMQEHISSQHVSQSSEVFGCPLCSLVCTSQVELQEHLLTLHVEPQSEQQDAEEERPSTSRTVRSSVASIRSDRMGSATSFLYAETAGHTYKNYVTTGVLPQTDGKLLLCVQKYKNTTE